MLVKLLFVTTLRFWMANVFEIAYMQDSPYFLLLNQQNVHTAYATLETFIASTCFGTTVQSSGNFNIEVLKNI
jgi:hypothetical protein